MDEKDLVRRLNNHDESAMHEIFCAWHSKLCAIAWRVIRDRDQAQDIVQEVFIKLWRMREHLDISTSLGAYLKRAVVNTTLNHIDRSSRMTKVDLDEAALVHTTLSAEQQLDAEELAHHIAQAVSKLPPRTRTVFSLIRSREMSYKEVSEALDISTKAVEKEMLRALKILRTALRHYLSVLLFVAQAFFS